MPRNSPISEEVFSRFKEQYLSDMPSDPESWFPRGRERAFRVANRLTGHNIIDTGSLNNWEAGMGILDIAKHAHNIPERTIIMSHGRGIWGDPRTPWMVSVPLGRKIRLREQGFPMIEGEVQSVVDTVLSGTQEKAALVIACETGSYKTSSVKGGRSVPRSASSIVVQSTTALEKMELVNKAAAQSLPPVSSSLGKVARIMRKMK